MFFYWFLIAYLITYQLIFIIDTIFRYFIDENNGKLHYQIELFILVFNIDQYLSS